MVVVVIAAAVVVVVSAVVSVVVVVVNGTSWGWRNLHLFAVYNCDNYLICYGIIIFPVYILSCCNSQVLLFYRS